MNITQLHIQDALGTLMPGILNGYQHLLEVFLLSHVLVHKVSKSYLKDTV